MSKHCKHCKIELPPDVPGYRCRPCNAQKTREYREKNPEYQKDYKLKVNYNLTREEVISMFDNQNGKCKICDKDLILFKSNYVGKHACIDHNHDTGKIRGILCDKCNRGLGFFNDNKELLKRASEYLDMEYC